MFVFSCSILLLTVIGLFFYITRPYRVPIFGIYTQQNGFYHLKYGLFYIMLTLRKYSNRRKRKRDQATSDHFALTLEDLKLDAPQPLSYHPKALDAVYFNTTSKDGDVMIVGLARRPKGVCNSFLYLQVAGQNLMLSPKLPESTLQQTPEEEGCFSVEGINLKPIQPMKTWSIQYRGKMRDSKDTSKLLDVEMDATWTAKFRHFDYDSDISSVTMAEAVARETWTKDYFQTLQEVHQKHYEQYGYLEGKVKINNVEHQLKTEGVRDHSFGKFREWKNFHRYGLHFLNLDNGDYITIEVISKPVCFSSLTIGFVCVESEKKIYPVDWCSLELFRHGEDFTPPLDYAFQIKAGGKVYTIQIDVYDSPTLFIGPEHESRVIERLVKCKVNNVPGWGAAEWYYRNIDGDYAKQLCLQNSK